MTSRGPRQPSSFFEHDALRDRYAAVRITPSMARGNHFLDPEQPWNRN